MSDELRLSAVFDVSGAIASTEELEAAIASLAGPIQGLGTQAEVVATQASNMATQFSLAAGGAGQLESSLVGVNSELIASEGGSTFAAIGQGAELAVSNVEQLTGALTEEEAAWAALGNFVRASSLELTENASAAAEAEAAWTALSTTTQQIAAGGAVVTEELTAEAAATTLAAAGYTELIAAREAAAVAAEEASIASLQEEEILIDIATQQAATIAATNGATVATQRYVVSCGAGVEATGRLGAAVSFLNNEEKTASASAEVLAQKLETIRTRAAALGYTVIETGTRIEILNKILDEDAAKTTGVDRAIANATARMGAFDIGASQLGFTAGILARSIPALTAAFNYLFAPILIITFIETISTLTDKFTKLQEEIMKANTAFDDLGTQGLRNVENLELQSLKLEDQIGKFEGRPSTNKLAEAIIESAQEVDKLTDSFERAIEKEIQLLDTGKIGLWRSALTGAVETTGFKEKADPQLRNLDVLVAAQNQANVELQLAQSKYAEAKDATAQKAAQIDLTAAQKAKENADKEVKTFTDKTLGILTTEQKLTQGQIAEINKRYDAIVNHVKAASDQYALQALRGEQADLERVRSQRGRSPIPLEIDTSHFETQKQKIISSLEDMRAAVLATYGSIRTQENQSITTIEAHVEAVKKLQKVEEERNAAAVLAQEDEARARAFTYSEAANKISDQQGQQRVQIAKENAQSILREEQAGLELQIAAHVRGGQSKAQADLLYSATKRFLISEETKDQITEETNQYEAHVASLERRKQADALKKPGPERDTALSEVNSELELAYTAHQAAMVRIARDGASKLTVERSKELDDEAKIAIDEKRMLDETNKAFAEAMKKRDEALKTSGNRADALQVRGENEELRGIQEQIKGYERLFQEHDIGSNQERKNLQASIALLEKKTKAAKAAVEATEGDIGKTAATQQTQAPGSQEYTNSAEKLQNLDKQLEQQTSLWRRYQQLLEGTNQAFSKLDITTKGFFSDMMNKELTAGLSWKSFADQFQMSWQHALTSVNQQFSNSVGQWILHGGSFVRAMQNMGAELVATLAQSFVKMGLVMLENWIATLLGMKVSQGVSSAGIVLAHAAEAGAAGVASWAGAPWPIDTGAPAFGAAMSAAAMSFLPGAAAEKGALLSADTNVLAHKNEMILPAHISKGLQGMISGGNVSTNNTSNTTSGNSIGRLQYQFSPIVNGNFDVAKHGDEMFNHLQGKLRRKGFNI